MIEGIVGKKLGMTHVFSADGKVGAVTAIEAGPCTVVQVKTAEKDGYDSVQVGFGHGKKIKSPVKGQMRGLGEFRYLRELRLATGEEVTAGQKIDVSIFKPGDYVHVTGVTKGKGFAGVVKRHHFRGGPKTHGQSDRERHPGAISSTTTPGHVWKGLRMAGRMGNEKLTTRNLKVVAADPAKNLLLVGGPVPGAKNGLLIINKSTKKSKGSKSASPSI